MIRTRTVLTVVGGAMAPLAVLVGCAGTTPGSQPEPPYLTARIVRHAPTATLRVVAADTQRGLIVLDYTLTRASERDGWVLEEAESVRLSFFRAGKPMTATKSSYLVLFPRGFASGEVLSGTYQIRAELPAGADSVEARLGESRVVSARVPSSPVVP